MKRTTLFTALLIASATACAQAPLEFKGVPLGATEGQLLEKYPIFHCRDTEKIGRVCSVTTKYYNAQCKMHAKIEPACSKSGEELLEMGGTRPATYQVIIRNGVVAQVVIWFPSLDFSGIAAAFSEKYGKPTADKESIVKNRMGAEFDNRIVDWTRNDGGIKLEKRATDIETSIILITAPAFYIDLGKASEEKAKVAASKL